MSVCGVMVLMLRVLYFLIKFFCCVVCARRFAMLFGKFFVFVF